MFNNYSIFYFDELLTSWTTLSVPLACAVLCGRPRGLSERQLNCVQIDCRREVLAVSPSSKSESSGQAPEHSAPRSKSYLHEITRNNAILVVLVILATMYPGGDFQSLSFLFEKSFLVAIYHHHTTTVIFKKNHGKCRISAIKEAHKQNCSARKLCPTPPTYAGDSSHRTSHYLIPVIA